jgi:hypothetical protein
LLPQLAVMIACGPWQRPAVAALTAAFNAPEKQAGRNRAVSLLIYNSFSRRTVVWILSLSQRPLQPIKGCCSHRDSPSARRLQGAESAPITRGKWFELQEVALPLAASTKMRAVTRQMRSRCTPRAARSDQSRY